MKRTIEWRLSEAQKNLILRAIVNCPCDAGIGETEHEEHHAQLRLVHSELEALGWGDSLWEYLNGNTRRKARAR